MFRAHDPREGRVVAIKAFHLDVSPDRAAALADALQELVSRGLDHPAIAEPVAAGLEGPIPWLAQAYVPAESLDVAIAEYGPPPLGDVLAIVTHLAGALDFAAAAGVLHGALHPSDVLVAPDETHLVGLGVAGALEACGIRAPLRGRYSAPEVMAGASPARAADVFALAAIAFELLAGEPIQGTGEAAAARLPEIPAADQDTLIEAFAFALADSMDERFPTALGFAGALKRALGDAPQAYFAPRRAVPVAAPPDDTWTAAPEAHEPSSEAAASESAPVVPAPASDALESGAADDDFSYRPNVVRDEEADGGGDSEGSRFWDLQDESAVLAHGSAGPDAPAAFAPAFELHPNEARDQGWEGRSHAPLPPARPAPRRKTGSVRTALVAAVLLGGLAVGLAGGYLWGRSAAAPTSEGQERTSTGTGVAIGGTAEGDPDGATEIELPPEVVPEALESGGEATGGSPELEPEPDAGEAAETPAEGPPPSAPRRADSTAPRPAPATGRIVIRSTPSGARVDVNGSPRGETPLTLTNLPLGAYDLRVTRQGYGPEQRRVTLTRGRPSHSVSVPMRRVAGTAGSGRTPASVLVDSRPRGATVFLDGRRVGTTPLQLPEVSAGPHVFRLELTGYRSVTTTAQIEAGERNRVAASLEEEIR